MSSLTGFARDFSSGSNIRWENNIEWSALTQIRISFWWSPRSISEEQTLLWQVPFTSLRRDSKTPDGDHR